MDNNPKLYTLKEASKLTRIPYRQILSACNAGEIPYYKIRQSRKMILINEVMAAIKNDGGPHE